MTKREEEEYSEWVEHLGKAAEAFCRDMKGIFPEETYRHLRLPKGVSAGGPLCD